MKQYQLRTSLYGAPNSKARASYLIPERGALLPIEEDMARNCGRCDSDQHELCANCPNRIPEDQIVRLVLDKEAITERELARKALALRGRRKDVILIVDVLQLTVKALRVLAKERNPIEARKWVNEHPIVCYLAGMMRPCDQERSHERLGTVVEHLAELW